MAELGLDVESVSLEESWSVSIVLLLHVIQKFRRIRVYRYLDASLAVTRHNLALKYSDKVDICEAQNRLQNSRVMQHGICSDER